MNLYKRVKRKIYKALHPSLGEVWMLHRCTNQRSDNPQQRELEITPAYLEERILKYKSKGFEFLSMDEVADRILKRRNIISQLFKNKFVAVTFDDGYRDNITEALPVLIKNAVPFIVYVTTDFIDNKNEMWWYPQQRLALSMSELKSLDAEPLCTIGAHTLSHPRLDTLSQEKQRIEIFESKHLLEKWLGHNICHFSYPHGSHTISTQMIACEAGFKTIACAWGGVVRTDASLEKLSRIGVKQEQ